jgi:hypothetical protein
VLVCEFFAVSRETPVKYLGYVPQTGCKQAIFTPERTLVCDDTTMYALDGVGHSRADVMARGVQFQGAGNVSLGGHDFSCNRPQPVSGTTV